MDTPFKIAPLCLALCAAAGCDTGMNSRASARPDEPLGLQGYMLGMSEKDVLAHGGGSCYNPPASMDADRICSASTSVSGQPALLFFYFFDDALEKLALTILPMHGQLGEVSKLFSGDFETRYGKPTTDNTITATWSRRGGAIVINRGDERTMTVNLTSWKYETEKTRRAKYAGSGIEI